MRTPRGMKSVEVATKKRITSNKTKKGIPNISGNNGITWNVARPNTRIKCIW